MPLPQLGGGSSARRAIPGRLIHKADFERLMDAPVWSRSAHFALHHVAGVPQLANKQRARPDAEKLSTELCPIKADVVDNSTLLIWAGAMVPKRHARRAVTRNLLKRQIREAFVRHGSSMRRGLWLVRLRQPFAAKDFTAARSVRLAQAARAELDQLLTNPPGHAVSRPRRPPRQGTRPAPSPVPTSPAVVPGAPAEPT